jgi:two-component system, NarL family, sensor kinase
MTTVRVADPAAWSRTVLADRRVPPATRGQAQETTRRLIAGSLAGLIVLVLAGYLIGARLAERQVLADASRFSGLLANGLLGPRLTPALLAGDPTAVREFDRVISRRLVPHSSLRRVKVWSSEGRILYSDDRREIGLVFPLTASQQEVLRTGGTVAEISDLSDDEDMLEAQLEPRLLETYTGMQADDGQRLLFETYMGYDQIREQREAVFGTLALLAVGGVALFAGFQLVLGRVNLRWVRRQQSRLDEQARVVSDRARQRLARDLHDGAVQDLVGASYLVAGGLQSIRGQQLPETERLLAGAAESVRNGLQSLRSVMIEVYPNALDDRGLAAALDDLVEPLRARGLAVDVTVLLEGLVSRETNEALYRGAQEAIRNVLHHARAAQAEIRVEASDGYAVLLVIDDGVGLPAGPVGSPDGHLGLSALTDLAAERGGYLEVSSAPGHGTVVRMELPR